MTRRKEVSVASAGGNPREQARRIDAEQERRRQHELDAISLKEKRILGPDGKVAAEHLSGGNPILEFMAIGQALKKGWATSDEKRRFNEQTGFNEQLYRRFSQDYSEQEARSFCSRYGFGDIKSYGRFVSLGYGDKLVDVGERDLTRMFFGLTAEPLLKELKRVEDPDACLQNFSMVMDNFPADVKAAVYVHLSRHPKALRRLLQINFLDGKGLVDFFRRFAGNPACFDGVVKP